MEMKKENIQYIRTLPDEIQNKIFFMFAEHPLASIFKKHVTATIKQERFLELEIKKHFNKPKTCYEPTINHTYYFRTSVSGNTKKSEKYDKLVSYYNRDYVKFYKDQNGKRKQLVEYEIYEKYW
jgi:hypothetical protein